MALEIRAIKAGVESVPDGHRLSAEWALCVVCMLGFMVDMGEIAISSALAAIFSVPGGNGPTSTFWLSLLLASTYVGGAIGAIGFGALTSRVRLRIALSASMLLLAVASFAAALAPDITVLTVARLVSGLAIGAYPPLAIALLTNHFPPRRRGSRIMTVSAVGTLGPLLTVYSVAQLTGTDAGFAGWQIVLIALGLLSLVTALGFAVLRGLDTSATAAASEAAPAQLEPAPSLPRATFILLAALYAVVPWAAVGFPMLSGAILVARGFPLIDALWFLGLVMLGPTFGSLLSAVVVDRFPRRTILFWLLGAGTISLVVFACFGSPWSLGGASVAYGMALGLYPPMLTLYAAELFPQQRRAAMISRFWALNRVSMIVAPLCLLPLLRLAGPLFLTLILAAILAVCAALTRFAPRGSAKEDLF